MRTGLIYDPTLNRCADVRVVDQEAEMKLRPNLSACASVCAIILAASIAAGACEPRVDVTTTDTLVQAAGPSGAQHQPRSLQLAQQCQSGRDDCLTRPQEECGPGLNDCLSHGEADCKTISASASGPGANPAGPNTAGLDKALQNPNLTPEQRDRLLQTKSTVVEASKKAASATATFQYSKCLTDTVRQCRASHC